MTKPIGLQISPWPWSNSRHAIYAGTDTTRAPIAYVRFSEPGDELPDNGHGNAALIAAAPELFDALRRLLARVKEPHGEGWELLPEWSAAHAAIAKAEGR